MRQGRASRRRSPSHAAKELVFFSVFFVAFVAPFLKSGTSIYLLRLEAPGRSRCLAGAETLS
jgi:hypothetical protein